MPPDVPRARSVLAVCLAVLMTAAGLGIFSGDKLRYPDERDYHHLASNLAAGRGYVNEQFQPTCWRPPGYPGLLALVYTVWERPVAAKLVNAFALASMALVLSRMAGAIRPGIGSLLAPALVLCYPLFPYTASTLYPQTIGALLLAACLWRIVESDPGREGGGWWRGAAAPGLLFGLLVLSIPSFLLLLPLIALYPPFRLGRAGFKSSVVFILAAALVIAPWTIRNYVRFRAFIPVSANSGINLLLGNSPNTRPNSGVNVDISGYEVQAAGLSEVEKNRFYQSSAIAWIRGHPGKALKLYCQKVGSYFAFRNELYTKSESARWRDLVLFLTYYPLLALVLIRLLLWRRYPLSRPELLLVAIYFGNALLSALFFSRIRFRVPFDALLIALVAIFASHLRAGKAAQAPGQTDQETPAY